MQRDTTSRIACHALALILTTALPAQPPQRLYAVGNGYGDGSSNLVEIVGYQTATPSVVDVGETGHVLTGIAVHPTTGELWAIDGTNPGTDTTLYKLNVTQTPTSPPQYVLTVTAVGMLGTPSQPICRQTALEFDPSGKLWCWGEGLGDVWRLDLQTGAATPVTAGTGQHAGAGMAFDLDGILYGSAQGWLATLAAGNGGVTAQHGNLQVGGFSGLEIDVDGVMYGCFSSFDSPSGVRLQVVDHHLGTVAPWVDVVGPLVFVNGLAFSRTRGFTGYGASLGTQTLGLEWVPGPAGSVWNGALKLEGFASAASALQFLAVSSTSSELLVGSLPLLVDPYTAQNLVLIPDSAGTVTLPLDLTNMQSLASLYLQAVQLATILTQAQHAASRGVALSLN